MVVLSIKNRYASLNDPIEEIMFPCSGVWAHLTDGTGDDGVTLLTEWYVGEAHLCVRKQH